MYLTSRYKGKVLSAFSKKKNLVMTQSYKSPINYDSVRESDTFDEVEDVQSSEVVLLTYANDGYYLNVPHVINDKGKYEEKNIVFETWQDYKDIDFNGWFMIEYDDETKKIHLKHFNTGKYMAIENGDDIFNDYAALREDRSINTEIVFE